MLDELLHDLAPINRFQGVEAHERQGGCIRSLQMIGKRLPLEIRGGVRAFQRDDILVVDHAADVFPHPDTSVERFLLQVRCDAGPNVLAACFAQRHPDDATIQ